jgi:natural product precursor
MNRLKLNRLNSRKMLEEKMSVIRGGAAHDECCCGCIYANQGGSNTWDNAMANNKQLLHSTNAGCDF